MTYEERENELDRRMHDAVGRQQRDLRQADIYLNRLRNKSKEYLVGMIEGMLVTGKIKVEE